MSKTGLDRKPLDHQYYHWATDEDAYDHELLYLDDADPANDRAEDFDFAVAAPLLELELTESSIDGNQLRRLFPSLRLSDAVAATARIQGPLSELVVEEQAVADAWLGRRADKDFAAADRDLLFRRTAERIYRI